MKKRANSQKPLLNEALRLLRVFYDIPRKELVEKLDISSSYLSELENGNKTVSMELLQRYADIFKIPPSSLLFFSEQLAERPSEQKIRFAVASRILKILDWIANKDEFQRDGKVA